MTPATTGHHDQIASGAWANWLWLAELPSVENALCLGSEENVAGAAIALSRLFGGVDWGSVDPDALAESWGPETFNLIVLDTSGASQQGLPDRLWPVCADLLRPGGVLTVISHNPLWYQRLGRTRRVVSQLRHARRRERGLRAAGFRTLQRFYMTPSSTEPRSFIPANRHAAAGYEQVAMKLSTRGTLRSRLARAGLHRVLYPATLLLAYR